MNTAILASATDDERYLAQVKFTLHIGIMLPTDIQFHILLPMVALMRLT